MSAHELSDHFLKSIDELMGAKDGKWAFTEFKTAHGVELRNGFLDACSELFVPFVGKPKPVILFSLTHVKLRLWSQLADFIDDHARVLQPEGIGAGILLFQCNRRVRLVNTQNHESTLTGGPGHFIQSKPMVWITLRSVLDLVTGRPQAEMFPRI
jgi:hypothetical protein